jgi:DNA-binding transcriptional MerR regulator
MATAELPNRSLFKAPEVCEIAQLQPYVLRSWESEFPDLGVTRAGTPGRVYRRHDVERVLRLKHLLFVEGLTLAGARRRLDEENTPLPTLDETEAAEPSAPGKRSKADGMLRKHLEQVQQGLRGLLDILERSKPGADFRLHAETAAVSGKPVKAVKGRVPAPAPQASRGKDKRRSPRRSRNGM